MNREGFLSISIAAATVSALSSCDAGQEERQEDIVIKGAIAALGVGKSSQETTMWKREGFSGLSSLPPSDIEKMDAARNRIQSALKLMGRSESPYFTTAANNLLPLIKRKTIDVWVPKEKVQDETRPDFGETKIRLGIVAPLSSLLAKDAVQIGLFLTRHNEHIVRMIAFTQTMKDFSLQEQFNGLFGWFMNPEVYLAENARAYGIEALAFVSHAALTRVWTKGTEEEQRAVTFIQMGSDFTSPQWRNYLGSHELAAGIKARQAYLENTAPHSAPFK